LAAVLDQDDFSVAFAFSRSEAASYRDANGALQTAPANAPRFDHAEDGTPRGFIVASGSALGNADRTAIDPLMLPADLAGSGADATVFHAYACEGAAPDEVERRVWYSRNAQATIDSLLTQTGHHLAIGVIAGFRQPYDLGGNFVRYRGAVWFMPGVLIGNAAGAALAADAAGVKPVVVSGAEKV